MTVVIHTVSIHVFTSQATFIWPNERDIVFLQYKTQQMYITIAFTHFVQVKEQMVVWIRYNGSL